MTSFLTDKVTELQDQGYCVLRDQLDPTFINACRDAFWPTLLDYFKDHGHAPNRGAHRHFLPMPFEPPCFSPAFFFDSEVLSIIQQMMGDRIVADQWCCDVPVRGSGYQDIHIDYQRPLFPEMPDLLLPAYMLVMSFGLVPIAPGNGAIEIAAGTHRMPTNKALGAVERAEIGMCPVSLDIGDVLIRHPWALHRGTPNTTDLPRALVSIRYVRHWYADNSREANSISQAVWSVLTPAQRNIMRFTLKG